MTKKSSKSLLDAVDTLIGANAVFEGKLKTDKTISIDGKFIGNIEQSLGLLIGVKAEVKGDINGEVIMISGTVKGNITATEAVELLPTAKVFGDIKTNLLTIAEGARFEGNSSMLNAEKTSSETKPSTGEAKK